MNDNIIPNLSPAHRHNEVTGKWQGRPFHGPLNGSMLHKHNPPIQPLSFYSTQVKQRMPAYNMHNPRNFAANEQYQQSRKRVSSKYSQQLEPMLSEAIESNSDDRLNMEIYHPEKVFKANLHPMAENFTSENSQQADVNGQPSSVNLSNEKNLTTLQQSRTNFLKKIEDGTNDNNFTVSSENKMIQSATTQIAPESNSVVKIEPEEPNYELHIIDDDYKTEDDQTSSLNATESDKQDEACDVKEKKEMVEELSLNSENSHNSHSRENESRSAKSKQELRRSRSKSEQSTSSKESTEKESASENESKKSNKTRSSNTVIYLNHEFLVSPKKLSP